MKVFSSWIFLRIYFLTMLIMVTPQLYWRKVLCGSYIKEKFFISFIKICGERCALQSYRTINTKNNTIAAVDQAVFHYRVCQWSRLILSVFALAGVHFWGELQHVGDLGWRKCRLGPIRSGEPWSQSTVLIVCIIRRLQILV